MRSWDTLHPRQATSGREGGREGGGSGGGRKEREGGTEKGRRGVGGEKGKITGGMHQVQETLLCLLPTWRIGRYLHFRGRL